MPFQLEAALQVMRMTLHFPPAVRGWNRLEGRPRTADFSRALRAEVRDPLWFLTRQWQFGEFAGEDAGSPVEVRTAVRVEPILHYAAQGGGAVACPEEVPLETQVEAERIGFDLALHAQVTRYFWRLIASAGNAAVIRAWYLQRYPLTAGSLAGDADEADTRRAMRIGQHRTLDAKRLVDELKSGDHDTAVNTFTTVSQTVRDALKVAGDALSQWFDRQYQQPEPEATGAWNPRFLEYQFAIATDTTDRGQSVLIASEYTQGHLDWFALDVDGRPGAKLERADGSSASVTPEVSPLSFIPAPVSFGGMPSHRYWEMESREIEFADIDANTTDVAKLLLTEFALVFGNDWCVIPYELPIGTLSSTAGMLITDDFGEQSLLLPAGRGFDDTWQRWSMFTLSRLPSSGAADTRLLLPPALAKTVEAPPLEKVHFLRDEMANMAWGVERAVASGLGVPISGYAETITIPVTATPLHPTEAPVRYVLGTDVPRNWIPFIPVHVPGSRRSVQLQRARMPSAEGEPKRKPRTKVLQPAAGLYFINEEEIPRSGKLVTRGYQRTRWLNGATLTWIGRRVTTGRGEGSSGLAFDQAVDVPRGT